MVLLFASLLILPVLATPSVVSDHFGNVPLKEIISAIFATCENITGATPEDVALMHDFKHLNPSEGVKCLMACAMEQFGLLENDGSPSWKNVYLYISRQFKLEDWERVMAIWTKCFNQGREKVGYDRCNFGYSLTQCFIDAINTEPNLDKTFFW